MIHWVPAPLAEWVFSGTYRDKNAVRVLGLAGLDCAHEVCQALDVVDAHHVDVVVEAERLDEGKVDLKSNVTLVLLVGGEDAECHAVWVAGGKTREVVKKRYIFCHPSASNSTMAIVVGRFAKLQYSHIHDFGRLINSHRQVVLLLSGDQQFLQGCACTLHP